MKKTYFNTIRGGPANPFLGVFEGEVSTWDIAELPPGVEIVSMGKGRGKVRTKNLEALVDHPAIKCVSINILDEEFIAALERLPNLEALFVSHLKKPPARPLRALSACRYLCIYNAKNLDGLEVIRGMPALKSLFLCDVKDLDDMSALQTVSLDELSVQSFIPGDAVRSIFSQRELTYLDLGGLKPAPDDVSGFARLTKLEHNDINPYNMPFEVYAMIDAALMPGVPRGFQMLYARDQVCAEGHALVEPVGQRARAFCPRCAPKKLDKLNARFRAVTGRDLILP